MKIAILYIATGKYICFWNDFYQSCEKFFLPDTKKHYFIFTDDCSLSGENITVIPRECRGFPQDSLFRFEMFLESRKLLEEYDYLFFFNANMLFTARIGAEFLPEQKDHFLLGVLAPADGIRHFPACFFFYERNPQSLAYIPPYQKNYHYFMGGINGGRTPEFLAMAEELSQNIRKDYDKGIVAIFHDESHLNHYFRLHPPKVLSSEYAVPQGWKTKLIPKIIIRDKTLVSTCFQKQPRGIRGLFKSVFEEIIHAMRWYL